MMRSNPALLGALLLTASSASALGGGTPVMTSVTNPWAMDYDPIRGGVWVTNGLLGEVTRIDQTGAVLQLVDLSTIPGLPSASPAADGICVMANGDLLLTDYNGDVQNIDDHLYQIDPDAGTLIGYWPTAAQFNTSVDGTKISEISGVEVGPSGNVFVTHSPFNPIQATRVWEIWLAPGTPGHWGLVQQTDVSVGFNLLGMDLFTCNGQPTWVFGRDQGSPIYFLDENLNPLGHTTNGNFSNSGVTIVPGPDPVNVWACYPTAGIGVFDAGLFCSGGPTYCSAKTSSAGCAASISTSLPWQPTSGSSDYSVTATGVQEGKNGLLFVSIAGAASLPFNGGTLCVQPPTKRGPIVSSGGQNPMGCNGSFATMINDGAIVPTGLDAGSGNSAWYQYWYRDPLNGAGQLGTALSNAIQLEFF